MDCLQMNALQGRMHWAGDEGGGGCEPRSCSSKTYESQLQREHYSIKWLEILIVGPCT